MTACPTCGKPVDALRARNVKVRGIQVVAYCSPECLAAAGDSAAVPAPTKPVAPDSGPVIEIRYEPASGVVTSARDERAAADAPAAKPAPEAKPDAKQPAADSKADKKADHKKADARKGGKPAPEPAKPEPAKKAPVLKIIEEAGAAPRDVTPPPRPLEGKPDKAPDKKAPDQKAPDTKTPDTKGQDTKGSDKKGSDKKSDAKGPDDKVSPAKLAQAPEPGKRRFSRETLERDHSNASQAEDWLEDEPANLGAARTGTAAESQLRPGGTKRALLILLAVALAGAGVLIAVKLLGKSSPATRAGSGDSGSASTGSGSDSGSAKADRGSGSALGTRVVGPERPPVAPLARARATEVLQHWLTAKDSTPRIQRLAAAALARTGDPAAIERLASALQHDNLDDTGRHDVAYALARAGDKRGFDVLVAALSAPRRDDKLSIGRLLVQLGDTRAVNALAPYLELPQHRVGAAEQLIRLGEPRAIKVFEQIRADAKASADDKARAAIGLAHAGRPGFGDELHALLADTHFNVYAAEILALKHDEAVRPVLIKQLEVTSLRVGAARALRLLAPAGDHAAGLAVLVAALDNPNNQKDTEQLSIAEAILLLAGDARWGERP